MISRSTLTRLSLVAVLAIVSGALLAACGGDDDESDTTAAAGGGEVTEVAIGTQPWIGYGPMWIADEKGFDTDNGVDIKLVNFTGRQELESGFASGKFQGSNNATNDSLRLADLGIDFKTVLMEDFSLEADAVLSCNPDIRSIEDVEGAKVGFEELSVSEVLFRYALEQAGISFDSIDYTPLPPDQAATAAVSGRIDVAVTYQPYLQTALDQNDDCEVIYTAGERPGLISDGLALSTDFIESNPEAVTGVLQAWGDAVDFYNSNTKEAQAIIAKNVGSDPKELGSTFAGVKLFDLQQSQDFLENDYEALWNDIRAILSEQDQIDGEPNAADFLDTSAGEQALGQ
jgi:NitT/TauT family transport system substrate-binding protein